MDLLWKIVLGIFILLLIQHFFNGMGYLHRTLIEIKTLLEQISEKLDKK